MGQKIKSMASSERIELDMHMNETGRAIPKYSLNISHLSLSLPYLNTIVDSNGSRSIRRINSSFVSPLLGNRRGRELNRRNPTSSLNNLKKRSN